MNRTKPISMATSYFRSALNRSNVKEPLKNDLAKHVEAKTYHVETSNIFGDEVKSDRQNKSLRIIQMVSNFSGVQHGRPTNVSAQSL